MTTAGQTDGLTDYRPLLIIVGITDTQTYKRWTHGRMDLRITDLRTDGRRATKWFLELAALFKKNVITSYITVQRRKTAS